MSKLSLKPEFLSFFNKFLQQALEIFSQNEHQFPLVLSYLLISLYFTQPLSYLFKQISQNTNKISFIALSTIFQATNFFEIMQFLHNEKIEISLYILMNITIFLPFLLILPMILLKNLTKTRKLFKIPYFLTNFLSKFLIIHQFCLMLPYSDFLVFYLKNKAAFLFFLSLFALFLNFSLGVFSLFLNRNSEFLCKSLKFSFNSHFLFVFFMRIAINLSANLLDNSLISQVFSQIFFSFSFSHFLINFPIFRTIPLNSFYLQALFIYETAVILLNFLSSYSIFDENHLFFLFWILAILAWKFALKISSAFYKKMVFSGEISVFSLEELWFLANEEKRLSFFIAGFFRSHYRSCADEKCRFLRKIQEKTQERDFIDRFIRVKFEALLDKTQEKTIFIMKFLTFLIKIDYNPIKSYFDLQKLEKKLNSLTNSSYENAYFAVLKLKLRKKIQEIFLQKTMDSASKSRETQVSSLDFFKTMENLSFFELKIRELLAEKLLFWEKYSNGFSSMSELLQILNKTSLNIELFITKLSNSRLKAGNFSYEIMRTRVLAISHLILTNKLNLFLKNNDIFENFLNCELSQNNDKKLKITSFLDPELATCQVSFLQNKGYLLKETRSEKLARFFGYSFSEFQSVSSISALMPSEIECFHDRFFHNFLNRNKNEVQEKKESVETFALSKEGFIFPVKVFLGVNLSFLQDFVMNAGFLKTDFNESLLLLVDSKGNCKGFSKKLYGFFEKFERSCEEKGRNFCENNEKSEGKSIEKSEDNSRRNMRKTTRNEKKFEKNDIFLLNIYPVIPKIKGILEKNMKNLSNSIGISKNIQSSFNLPENLSEMFRVLREKKEEEREYKAYSKKNTNSRSLKSLNKSEKSLASTSNKRNYINNLTKTYKLTEEVKDSLNRKEGRLSNEEIIEVIFTRTKLKKSFISFDFRAFAHRYGPSEEEILVFFIIDIKKINEDGVTFNLFDEKNEEFGEKLEEIKVEIEEKIGETQRIATLPGENSINFKQIFTRVDNTDEFLLKKSEFTEEKPRLTEEKVRITEEKVRVTEDIQKIEEKSDEKSHPSPTASEKSQQRKSAEKVEKNMKNSKKSSKKIIKLQSYRTQNFEIEKRNFAENNSTSAVSTLKRTFLIYDTIETIQTKRPSAIKSLFFLFLFEILVILAFYLSLFSIYQSYVDNSYKPIQKTMINFCKLMDGMELTMILMSEIEYNSLNLTENPLLDLQKEIFPLILAETFSIAKTLAFALRNNEADLLYKSLYLNLLTKSVDKREVSKIKFADLMDLYIAYSGKFLDKDTVFSANYSELIFLQRNFPYLMSGAGVLKVLQDEFLSSNEKTTQMAMVLMVAFIVVNSFIKLAELYQLLKVVRMINFLMNIFRRISRKETESEISFFSEIFLLIKKPFIHMNFLERFLSRNNEEIGEKNEKIVKNAKSSTGKKNAYSFKQMQSARVFIVVAMISTISFCYFFFNYYYWLSNNQNITNLIQINIFFENLYIYSTSILAFSVVFVREKLVRNSEYELSGEFYQNHANRLQYAYSNFLTRFYVVSNITANYMVLYTMDAKNSLDSADFNKIVSGDLCLFLKEKGDISDKSLAYCQGSLNQAFTKGILNTMNEFLLEMSYVVDLSSFIEEKDPVFTQQQKEKALVVVSASGYMDLVNSHYFLTRILLYYYENINEFYQGIMDNQMSNLQTFLLLTSILFGMVFLGLAMAVYWGVMGYYRNVTLGLNLIPYERLTNDEQSKFLMKQFLKNFE